MSVIQKVRIQHLAFRPHNQSDIQKNTKKKKKKNTNDDDQAKPNILISVYILRTANKYPIRRGWETIREVKANARSVQISNCKQNEGMRTSIRLAELAYAYASACIVRTYLCVQDAGSVGAATARLPNRATPATIYINNESKKSLGKEVKLKI